LQAHCTHSEWHGGRNFEAEAPSWRINEHIGGCASARQSRVGTLQVLAIDHRGNQRRGGDDVEERLPCNYTSGSIRVCRIVKPVRRDSELVDFLFPYRGRLMGSSYLSVALIPMSCH